MNKFIPSGGFENDYLEIKKQLQEFDRNKVKIWDIDNDKLPLNYTINAYPLSKDFKDEFTLFTDKLKKAVQIYIGTLQKSGI